MYSKIPAEMKPTKKYAKLTYDNSFDSKFSLLLRERRTNRLVNMQEASLQVESNLMAANKLRGKSDHHGEDKKKKKQMSLATSWTKAVGSKMNDMTKLIKNLSTKISTLEMENKNKNKYVQGNDNKNPNQF